MKRFLFGLSMGVPVGVALVVYLTLKGSRMIYYRIAAPDLNGKYAGIGGMFNTEAGVLHWLRISFSSGRNIGNLIVFAGSSVQRVQAEIEMVNERKNVVAVAALDMLNGTPFGWKEAQAREAAVDEERNSARTLIENQVTRNRFNFARWLYQTGRITDWPAESLLELHQEVHPE